MCGQAVAGIGVLAEKFRAMDFPSVVHPSFEAAISVPVCRAYTDGMQKDPSSGDVGSGKPTPRPCASTLCGWTSLPLPGLAASWRVSGLRSSFRACLKAQQVPPTALISPWSGRRKG